MAVASTSTASTLRAWAAWISSGDASTPTTCAGLGDGGGQDAVTTTDIEDPLARLRVEEGEDLQWRGRRRTGRVLRNDRRTSGWWD